MKGRGSPAPKPEPETRSPREPRRQGSRATDPGPGRRQGPRPSPTPPPRPSCSPAPPAAAADQVGKSPARPSWQRPPRGPLAELSPPPREPGFSSSPRTLQPRFHSPTPETPACPSRLSESPTEPWDPRRTAALRLLQGPGALISQVSPGNPPWTKILLLGSVLGDRHRPRLCQTPPARAAGPPSPGRVRIVPHSGTQSAHLRSFGLYSWPSPSVQAGSAAALDTGPLWSCPWSPFSAALPPPSPAAAAGEGAPEARGSPSLRL